MELTAKGVQRSTSSIASVGSILSIGSSGSVLSINAVGAWRSIPKRTPALVAASALGIVMIALLRRV